MLRTIFRVGVFLALFALVLCGFPSPSMSQGVEAWTNLGIYGGQIYDIAIDHSNPEKMFAGSYMGDGLFVTEDGGSSWRAVETEHQYEGEDTFKDHAVWAVKIAPPPNNNTIWVAHNYWAEKSWDGGQTWTHVRNSTMQRDCPNCGGDGDNYRFCRSLAVDPSDPQTVYVGTGGPYGAYSSGAIYKSVDGGLEWWKTGFDASNEFDYTVVDINIDPQNHNVIWAVTSSFGYGGFGGTLYRSGNGGETWEEIFSLTPSGSAYLTVAVKPNDSNTVFTGSGFGIIKHYFDGSQWQFIWPVIEESRLVQDISFDPQDPEVLYAVWRNPWFGDLLPKVARSTNGGVDWEIYTVDYEFLTVAVHPANSELIFGGELNLGVFRSQDHGQTWAPINNGINAVIVYDVVIDPNDSTHLLVGTISGVYEKKPGEDWSRLLPYRTRSVQFHPEDSTTFYAGIDGWLAKTEDGGQSWTYSNMLADGSNHFNDIAIDPTNINTILIAINGYARYGEIHKSTDGGITFVKVLDGENQSGEKYSFNAVAIDPSDSQHIFAGGGNFYAPKVLGELWESTDEGYSWTRTSLQNVIVNDLLIDPRNPNIMYAGCGYSDGAEIPLYKSTDGGSAWAVSYEGIPDMAIPLRDIWGSSTRSVLVVGHSGTILHYDGNSWAPMSSGTTEQLNGIWGSSGADVFSVGHNGTVLHYDGSTWAPMSSGTTEVLENVWGSSETNVFAVGDNGTILHYDGSTWAPMSSGTTEGLKGVWGSSGTDVFAVGDNGTILHYDGSTWAAMSSGTTEVLENVWGSSGTDVFAVGDNGTILHYDGSGWAAMSSGTTKWLNGVWGSSETDVFAVGDNGTILHYDGGTWTKTDLGTKESCLSVWGASGKDVLVGGDYGSILHYDGSSWFSMRAAGSSGNAVTDLEFHRENTKVIYASTFGAGVYVSPNRAGNWLNFGTPEHHVFAISTSSLYAASEAGLLQCTGTGVIAGEVKDALSGLGIDGAIVFNDMGVKTLSVNGEYMMVSPCGICCVTVIAPGHANTTEEKKEILGGDVTWVDIDMESGVPDPSVGPGTSVISSGGGSYCFVATASYGSPLAKELEILRAFRDDYLLPHRVGQKLVALYYSKGNSIAMYIESHPWLKGPARIALYPMVGLAWLLLLTTASTMVVVGVCIFIGCAGVSGSLKHNVRKAKFYRQII